MVQKGHGSRGGGSGDPDRMYTKEQKDLLQKEKEREAKLSRMTRGT